MITKHLPTDDRTEWTVEDHLSYARTGTPPLNSEWVERKNEALADAGIEVDDDQPKALEEMSPAEHEARKYGGR